MAEKPSWKIVGNNPRSREPTAFVAKFDLMSITKEKLIEGEDDLGSKAYYESYLYTLIDLRQTYFSEISNAKQLEELDYKRLTKIIRMLITNFRRNLKTQKIYERPFDIEVDRISTNEWKIGSKASYLFILRQLQCLDQILKDILQKIGETEPYSIFEKQSDDVAFFTDDVVSAFYRRYPGPN